MSYEFTLKNKKCVRKEDIVFETQIDGRTVDITEKFITDDLTNAEKLIVINGEELIRLQARRDRDVELLLGIREANKDIEPELGESEE